ncbi:unnamed protein product [Cuscuta europaea]|uniref:Uncharacterized protein n=1 Tax=Cuscuta europaea TaxID=41803 RepID=A0A9P0YBR3_CUSEU|nr:unnamed protein product [Cuscuta europaea]
MVENMTGSVNLIGTGEEDVTGTGSIIGCEMTKTMTEKEVVDVIVAIEGAEAGTGKIVTMNGERGMAAAV